MRIRTTRLEQAARWSVAPATIAPNRPLRKFEHLQGRPRISPAPAGAPYREFPTGHDSNVVFRAWAAGSAPLVRDGTSVVDPCRVPDRVTVVTASPPRDRCDARMTLLAMATWWMRARSVTRMGARGIVART
jgi:hypothetical protein